MLNEAASEQEFRINEVQIPSTSDEQSGEHLAGAERVDEPIAVDEVGATSVDSIGILGSDAKVRLIV